MKTKLFYLLLLAALLLNVNSLYAQKRIETSYVLSGNHIKNLITGIQSDNLGLRRSAIYLAGKYKVAEAGAELLKALEKEEDSSTKILIALSLFNISEPNAMKAVNQLSMNEQDPKVKRMLTNIYSEYMKSFTAEVEK